MKTLSPRQIAIIIAIISSLSTAIFQILLYVSSITDSWKLIVISALSIFIITYAISYHFIQRFIINKIKPIYKTIRNIKIPSSQLAERFEDKNIIDIVDKEVKEWTRTKAFEINQLKKLEKYRREFLGNVSHELKTPIFNIQGYVLTLLDGGLEDETINTLYLERTEKSINRLISIVEDLEAISRLEAGELELQIATFNIVQLVHEVFEIQEMKAKEKGIKFQTNFPENKSIMVKADRHQMIHVLNNLINNSIKYGKAEGTTKVDFFDMDKNILIEVSDNGIGIAKNDVPRLFERFFRADKSRSREQGGTGLGLAIVKHIIEAHDQTINVRSKLGEGTSFAFTMKKK